MNISFKKVLRDINLYKGRTFLMLTGILIGIAAVGAVLSSYAVLTREMNRNFMDTNPSSMIFSISNLDDNAKSIVKAQYPNTEIELKKNIQARISRGDGTYGTIYLEASQDLTRPKLDTFELEKGLAPENNNQLLLERDDLKILKNLTTGVGESVILQLPGGSDQTAEVSGLVHAPGLPPASMENFSFGFVSLDFLRNLGYTGTFDELRLVSYDKRMDMDAMKSMAAEIKALLTANGYEVVRTDVPKPGKHPHADQLSSLLFLLQAFAVISLLAACLIIVNLMNFIISRQSKQIAIMKAVGGKTRDITVPYFLYIFLLSLGAIAFSFPISLLMSRGYTLFAANILNFDIASYAIPSWVLVTQVLVGLFIPLLSAAQPIYKYCGIKIKDGLNEQIAPLKTRKTTLKRSGAWSSSTILPINNLLRKKLRTGLAILALVAGGVLFMTSQNIIASIDNTVNENISTIKWDFETRLSGQTDKQIIYEAVSRVKGLENTEIWGASSGFFKTEAGYTSANYLIKVVPNNTKMANLTGIDAAPNSIVVNQVVAEEEPWLKVNQEAALQVGNVKTTVLLSGIITELPPFPTIYMTAQTYGVLIGGNPKQILFTTANSNELNAQRQMMIDTEKVFSDAGIKISENINVYLRRKAFVDHLRLIVNFLSAMAMLAVAVGGIGISSTIGINISERKHEIGVLRAMGANSKRVYIIILTEVLLMGLAGWILGLILSLPTSVLVGNYFGNIFLHSNLSNVLSMSGSVVWMIISVSAALIAGFIPARIAAGSSLREMLSYE